ncbi:MAG: hypothetical protein H8F28_07485, partial [Fibrella sp.]|nr:hypothetical protein [Armatimonadota bacterium]
HDLDTDDIDDDATLDMEMALFAMSASDVGGPLQDIDLSSLSAEEKRSLLAYLRHRFNFAPDPEGLAGGVDVGEEPASPPTNGNSV